MEALKRPIAKSIEACLPAKGLSANAASFALLILMPLLYMVVAQQIIINNVTKAIEMQPIITSNLNGRVF